MYKFLLFFILGGLPFLFAQDTAQLDDDYDLIINKYDKCPNTPKGVCVDKDGCTQVLKRVVHFDSNSNKIDTISKQNIKNISEIAKECFGYKIIIEGHTDSISNEKYNTLLSKQRAYTVRRTLINQNIDPKRISIQWYGETQPSATNITKDGRYQNRRVEILFK